MTLWFKNIFALRTRVPKKSNNNDFRPFSRPRNPTKISKCGSQCGKMTQSSIPSHQWSIFVVKKSKEKNEK